MTDAGIAGGRQCGAVRYTLMRGPHAVYACHCRECQKQSASAFALSIPIAADDLAIEGELAACERLAASGSTTRCWFCRKCSVRLYHQSARAPGRPTVKAGTLDDTSELSSVAHLWTSRKQPWVILNPTIPAFETQPEDLAAWRAEIAKL